MSKIEVYWVIQREDGKYYTGKGSPTWRGDPSWKVSAHSATLYTEKYLPQALILARARTDQKCRPIKIILEVLENEQESDLQKLLMEERKKVAELKAKYEDCDKERLENRLDYLNMKNAWLSVKKELEELKGNSNVKS